MGPIFPLFSFLALFFLHGPGALGQSTPVYLSPYHSAPTGHFDRELLKKKALAYEEYEWLWVKDSKGKRGWILKASALLPLDFSRQGVLEKGKPIYLKPQSFALPDKTPNQSQVVDLVERRQDWYKIAYRENQKKVYGWVKARHLRPSSKDSGYFLSIRETHLRAKPQGLAKSLQVIDPGQSMVPLRVQGQWAWVQWGPHRGYVLLKDLKSRLDVAMGVRTHKGYFKPHPRLYGEKVQEIFANPLWVGSGSYTLELKARPDTSGPTVAQVSPWEDLVVQGYALKRWGKSGLPQWGELWWPDTTLESNVAFRENPSPAFYQLSKGKIYQMEQSPVVSGLHFASTSQGVYRSFDGLRWEALKPFKKAFPLKLTKNGTLFVGDQVSFDHGESFRPFVRWDLIFHRLGGRLKTKPGPVQILRVAPDLGNPEKVTLSLSLGSGDRVRLYTSNLGRNWSLL